MNAIQEYAALYSEPELQQMLCQWSAAEKQKSSAAPPRPNEWQSDNEAYIDEIAGSYTDEEIGLEIRALRRALAIKRATRSPQRTCPKCGNTDKSDQPIIDVTTTGKPIVLCLNCECQYVKESK